MEDLKEPRMTKETTIIAQSSPYYYEKHMLQDPYDEHGIRLGSWEISVCNVCAWLPMTLFTVVCGPSIAVAQVRVRLYGRSYGTALCIEMLRSVFIIGLPFAVYALVMALLDMETSEDKASKKQSSDASTPLMMALWAVGLLWVMVIFFSVLSLAELRARIRERFQIDGSRGGDMCVVLFLPTCTVAQMSTHMRCMRPGRCSLHRPDALPPYEY